LNEFFPLFAGRNKKYIFDVKKCIYLYNFISKKTVKQEQILDFFIKCLLPQKSIFWIVFTVIPEGLI